MVLIYFISIMYYVFINISIMFKPFSTRKLKNLIFDIPIIPQTLNIYNQKSTSAQSINFNIRLPNFPRAVATQVMALENKNFMVQWPTEVSPWLRQRKKFLILEGLDQWKIYSRVCCLPLQVILLKFEILTQFCRFTEPNQPNQHTNN